MIRRLLGNRIGETDGITYLSFDTVGTGDAFTIRRESDNVIQSFTYSQITDGTFDSFVSGTEGAIREWKGNLGTLSNTTGANQMRLKSNVGNPFVDDYAQPAFLKMSQAIDMSGDSVITMIMKDETNQNSQRTNLSVRGSGTNSLSVALYPNFGTVVYDKSGTSVIADYQFSYSNNGLFKLLTFVRKGGIKKIHINNIDTTPQAADTNNTIEAGVIGENTTYLGAGGSGDGKITKYRHVGIVVGADATNLDISAYNQSIMTKYGL